MFKIDKEIYIDDANPVDGAYNLILHINDSIYRIYSNVIGLAVQSYLEMTLHAHHISNIIIQKLIKVRKIYKLYKTNIIINSKIKKFIQRVKERFYNPDSEINFMKKHANKYIHTLGTLIT